MAFDKVYKDPDTHTYFTVDWTPAIRPDETAVQSAQWVVPTELTHDPQDDELVGNVAKVWLDGGDEGEQIPVTCRATFDSGRTDDWTLLVVIQST